MNWGDSTPHDRQQVDICQVSPGSASARSGASTHCFDIPRAAVSHDLRFRQTGFLLHQVDRIFQVADVIHQSGGFA